LLEQGGRPIAPPELDAYIVLAHAPALGLAMHIAEQLRAAGFSALLHAGGGSMKSQMKKADASGARHALIFGEDELSTGTVTVKSLRQGQGEASQQNRVGLEPLAGLLAVLASPAAEGLAPRMAG
jgi:histidyl-tRNA synthetase